MSTHPLVPVGNSLPLETVLPLANWLELSDLPLLTLIFEHVDDSMLAEIAICDYGDDVEIHLAALDQIRANNIPRPMQWHPREVLELTRWTEWESLNIQNESISTRNHWMRLFACTVLIWASLEPEDQSPQERLRQQDRGDDWYCIDGEDSTIIQFLDSALYLGDDVSTAALKFLGWRMQSQIQRALIDEDFGYCPLYAVAMLLLCVSLVGGKPASLKNRCHPEIVSFLISVTYCNHEYIPIFKEIDNCQRSQKWRDTIYRILLDPAASDYARTNPELQRLAMESSGNIPDPDLQ